MSSKYTKAHPLPPQIDLSATFILDSGSKSGVSWRRNGRRAGCVTHHGYWRVTLRGRYLLVHRIVWTLATGRDPVGFQIDHIDGDGLNNALTNLRLATASENGRNRSAERGAQSQLKGVSRCRRSGRWRAYIGHSGSSRALGTYGTEVEAARAYDRAASDLHGEFARLNFP